MKKRYAMVAVLALLIAACGSGTETTTTAGGTATTADGGTARTAAPQQRQRPAEWKS